MDLKEIENRISMLTKENLGALDDEELKKARKEFYVLWDNGIKFRDINELMLYEFNLRGSQKAMSYSDNEIIALVINQSLRGWIRDRSLGSKLPLDEGTKFLKETLNNSGGTLSDSLGFTIGSIGYDAKGVKISVSNALYVKRANSKDIITIGEMQSRDRYIYLTYSEIYKKALSLEKSTRVIRPMSLNVGLFNEILLAEASNGQFCLF